VKLIFKPKSEDLPEVLLACASKEYNFRYCYTMKGEKFYEPDDINFPSSNPVGLSELKSKERG
jgi:hypothetical protein